MKHQQILVCLLLKMCMFCLFVQATSAQIKKQQNLLYVDAHGVLRYTRTKAEASFFGVNYTVPFAYGYRSVKRLGIDIEKEIDDDVYHFSRLGLDAFRLHVWDWEISDSAGNLLNNDHLRLFDYLLSKLQQRNIRVIITPIAFWGNGYPERDIHTHSFSDVYGKGAAVVNEHAIEAQENYLKQFFNHVNQYTKLAYKDDENIIGTELNNEPHHSGPKEKTTEYINRLAAAVRSTGWTKPVFYNISESPSYADAVAQANVQGHSFQWYPTGLVANHMLRGNFLPNVDRYVIPFTDTIPAFKNKARMVYEFDAGDVLQSNMYPAIARSFRTAGFQWVTQFAYDPMATAYANTEYQTHYLNLAYTPSKAISLMIAAKAFHKLPRLKSYGTYPADTTFDVFRVSYKEQISEMNSEKEFYYSNSTTTQPVDANKLAHVAGVGSSAVVNYNGYGAYFIDKISDGTWRLEVMPDAIHIRDPFERASPNKEVTRIQWQAQPMEILLPDLGDAFVINGINKDNSYKTVAASNSFIIQPGTYLLINPKKANKWSAFSPALSEFVAPKPFDTNPFVSHQPFSEVSANVPFSIHAKIVGISENDTVRVELRHSANKWKTLQLKAVTPYDYTVDVPADIVTPGLINYRIIIHKANGDFVVFPGNHQGNPYAWDAYENETWQTFVASPRSPILLFNALNDRAGLDIYNPSWRNNSIAYITGPNSDMLIQKMTKNDHVKDQLFGWQLFIGDKLKERETEVAGLQKMIIKATSGNAEPVTIKVVLLTSEGAAFSKVVSVTNAMSNIEIPLNTLIEDSTLLLPRPYPGFEPLMFKPFGSKAFSIQDVEKLQLLIVGDKAGSEKENTVEVESISLK